MALLENLKLNKQLIRSMTDAGLLTAKEIQAKSMSRILGGQDIIGIGPEGCGKTTTYILGVLMRLKYGIEEAPRALVLVPDRDKVDAVVEQFNLLNKNKTIRILGLYAPVSMETQLNALADGVDIVVATPDRARAIYLKLGLNLNKILMFIVDDAELIVKQGLQLPVCELANSILKCQHLVFSEVLHEKLEQMIDPFMKQPALIEIEEMGESKSETFLQLLYHVPNFRTKLNLLNLLVQDVERFTKVVVFVNTRLTAEKLYKSVNQRIKGEVAILNPIFFESKGFEYVEDFEKDDNCRVLIIANELLGSINLEGIPYLIHFELPDEKETFIGKIVKRESDENFNPLAITFATDIELSMVRKIEQAIGKKLLTAELPSELIVEKEEKKSEETKSAKDKVVASTGGGAFHEKKESNAKDYNYSSKVKAKMNKKRNHM